MTQTETSTPHDHEATQARMTFGEHLEELRRRVVHSMMGAVFGIGLCLYFMYDIFDLIARPFRLAALHHGVPDVFNTLKPQEAFMTLVTLSVEAGLILTSPWIIYQVWKFIAAGLYPKERKIVYRYVGPSVLLFLLGVAFFYFIVLPLTLNFFFGFTQHSAGPPPQPTWLERVILRIPESAPTAAPPATTSPATTATTTAPTTAPAVVLAPATTLPSMKGDPPVPPEGQAYFYFDETTSRIKVRWGEQIYTLMVAEQDSMFTNVWRASDYLSFVAFSALVFGLAFEMPMVILILAQIGIVETQTFRNVRKYAYFGILIAAVMVAPTGDPLTLMLLFVPLVALYELGIILAALVVRKQEEAA